MQCILERGSVQKGCIHFSFVGACRTPFLDQLRPPSLDRPSILPPPIVAIANWHLLCVRAGALEAHGKQIPSSHRLTPSLVGRLYEGIHGAFEGRRRHKTDHVHKAAS